MQRQSEREGFGRAYGSLKRKEKKRKWQTDGNLKKNVTRREGQEANFVLTV